MWHAIARSFLNIRCANFRDKYQTWSVNKQKDYYSKCMSQDCEQSLESGKDNPGCRYVEPKWGFCYGEPRHCHQPHPTPLPCLLLPPSAKRTSPWKELDHGHAR